VINMSWSQQFEPVKADDVCVIIEVEGWPPEANRQVAQYVRGLIAKGAKLSGDGEAPRIFAIS
jgi:hypothetical protein